MCHRPGFIYSTRVWLGFALKVLPYFANFEYILHISTIFICLQDMAYLCAKLFNLPACYVSHAAIVVKYSHSSR